MGENREECGVVCVCVCVWGGGGFRERTAGNARFSGFTHTHTHTLSLSHTCRSTRANETRRGGGEGGRNPARRKKEKIGVGGGGGGGAELITISILDSVPSDKPRHLPVCWRRFFSFLLLRPASAERVCVVKFRCWSVHVSVQKMIHFDIAITGVT